MSWISGLAGRAENFLNTLDNSAAQALNRSQDNLDKRNYNSKIEPTVIKEYDKLSQRTNDSLHSAGSIKSLPLEISGNKSSTKIGVRSNNNFNTPFNKITSEADDYKNSQDFLTTDINIDNNPNIENKLLRSEISSLNQEISSLLQRNHKSEEESKRLRNQLEKVSSQLRDCDKKYRELISEKDDLVETMKVKDQKLSVLQSEIQLLNMKKSDSALNADAHVITDNRNKILLLEQDIKTKNAALEQLESEKLNWQHSLDDSKLKLSQVINNYEKSRNDDKRKIDILTEQVDVAKQKTSSIQQDLKEYKIKAANILQMKEKVIASLRGDVENVDEKLSHGASYTEDMQQEMIDIRQESDLLREEIVRCRLELEHKDFDLQELDHQMHTETESLRKNLDLLEEQLDRERQLKEDLDTDYRQLTKENRHLQEKYMREKADFQDHLALKDEEIVRLRTMVSTKCANQTDQVIELESRVRSLTDTLIQKQAALDSNKADYYSLQIRLERTEMELKTFQKMAMVPGSSMDRRIGGGGVNNNEFISINMQDAPVTKNFKTALNSLDRFSLSIGLFLRRYPPARLFFIIYTVVLHLWMLFVFLTYQPEIHMSSNSNVPNVPVNPK